MTCNRQPQSPEVKAAPRDVQAKMSRLQQKYSAGGPKDARSFLEHLDNMAAEYKSARALTQG